MSDLPLAGRVIDNPISGERIVIQAGAADTDGRLLAFDLFLPPGGHVPAGHVHPLQEERFTVVHGTLRFRVDGRVVRLAAGQSVRVPPGTRHWFGNAGPGPAHAHVEVRPALRMEELLRQTATLGRSGHLLGTCVPRLSDLALLLLEFRRELGVPFLPAGVVRLVLAPLAWLGQRRAGAKRPAAAEP